MEDKMTESEIRIAMLMALRTNNLAEGRRLQKLRHDIIERECVEQHYLIDAAFERFWEQPSNTWIPPFNGHYDSTIHSDGSIVGEKPLTLKMDLGNGGYGD